MDDSAFDKLTERQRTCLRLVGTLANSKEIARQLGISRHTVDEHIREAIATLGLASRAEAARALVAFEAGTPQRLSTQPLGIETDAAPDASNVSLGEQDGESQDFEAANQSTDAVLASWPQPPFPTRGRHGNDLDRLTRLFWIGAVLVGLILAASLFTALVVRYSSAG